MRQSQAPVVVDFWSDYSSWKFTAANEGETFAFQMYLNQPSPSIRLRVPQAKFKGQPYEIVVMRID
ncbi:MAG: hypothetical protein H6613_06655 [Ignavibacteriales bacterium]|nr:hypothetical protein [Ignavibacteriales bacterium]